MRKHFASWTEVTDCCDNIHRQIQNEQFDKIVGIARGGAIPGVILSHKLGIPVYTIGLKTYEDEKQTDHIEVYGLDPVFYLNCKNKRILIVDDICDSGQSILILKELFSRCTTIPPKFATLYYKPLSSQVKPDFYAQDTARYIVFPWEKEKQKQCEQCSGKMDGHEDESATQCRWCVTGWKSVPNDYQNAACT